MNKRILILSIILYSSDICVSQWTQTNGIYGGSAYKVFAVNGKVYAALTYGTMYFSSDGGQSYTIRSSGIKGVSISSFASTGNTVFASSGTSGIYKTSNDGVNRVNSNSGLRTLNVSSLAVNGNTLCASTYDGFYTSTNEGASWIEPDTSFHIGISSLSVSNNFIYAAVSYSTVLQTSNNGISWDTLLTDPFHYVALQTIASKDSEIYTAGYLSGLYRSTNSGMNWSYVSNAPSFIYSFLILDNKVLAASSSGLYSSNDKGMTWNLDSNGIIPYIDTRSISADGDNIYVGVGNQYYPHSIYKSTDLGNSWNPSSSNIIGTNIFMLHKIDNQIYTSAYYKGLFYTTDIGDTWINANADLSGYDHQQIQSMGNCQSNYLLLSHRNFISTNSGVNWNVFGSSSNPHFYEFLNVNDTILALKEYPWKSTDCGITWTASRNGFTPGNYGGELRYTGQFAYVIAGTSVSTSTLFRSGDFGNNWTPVHNTASGFRLRHLAAKDNKVFLAYRTQQDTGIITSDNYGEVFHFDNSGLNCRNVNTLFIDSNIIYAGTVDGVFYKAITEDQWHTLNNNEFNMNVTCFLADSNYLYAGTEGNGIWRTPRYGVITSAVENPGVVLNFSLSQNFPNPFNPSTSIKFSLYKSAFVKLSVYNISGKEVVRLTEGNHNEGEHSIIFNGRDLPSGIYFAKLTSGNRDRIIKMVLSK